MANLYQCVFKGVYQNQLIINAPTFISSNDDPATATAVGLARALGFVPTLPTEPATETVLEAYLGAQSDLFQMNELMVRNLYDVNDFYTVVLSGSGWAGVNVVADLGEFSFVASKIQTNRVRQDIGRGSMALTPLAEGNYNAQGVLDVGALETLQELCDRLNEPPSFTEAGSSTDFIPCVISKERRQVPDSNPPRYAYYFYETEAEQLDHVAQGVTWSPKPTVSTQTSRTIGKGA